VKRCRSLSQVPSASRYGAYCTNSETICLPGGASAGSYAVGMPTSIIGSAEVRPYFASSQARSM
jgi:hypothetical protein